ncbi:hypothetical protein [Catellatospora methionotrophica]|uniref:hypothetical protein n=1 Tax=Catellatospora methionotrophica TaxID=121620 RepID=UPI0033BFDC60
MEVAGLLGEGESIRDPGTGDGPAVRIDILVGAGVAALRVIPREPVTTASADLSMIEFSTVDGHVLRRLDLVHDLVAWTLCYRGQDLLWSDGRKLRIRRAGAVTDGVVMPLEQSDAIKPSGCRSTASQV